MPTSAPGSGGPSRGLTYWCSFLLITSNVGNGHQQLALHEVPIGSGLIPEPNGYIGYLSNPVAVGITVAGTGKSCPKERN